jgi:threonine synthase
LAENGGKGFFLETAHPVKFPDSVEKQRKIGGNPEIFGRINETREIYYRN